MIASCTWTATHTQTATQQMTSRSARIWRVQRTGASAYGLSLIASPGGRASTTRGTARSLHRLVRGTPRRGLDSLRAAELALRIMCHRGLDSLRAAELALRIMCHRGLDSLR